MVIKPSLEHSLHKADKNRKVQEGTRRVVYINIVCLLDYCKNKNKMKKEWQHATHCKENPIYVFLFWELRGLRPNFHIHVSVSKLYIPKIRQTDPENI
jgi:hypothetical protein